MKDALVFHQLTTVGDRDINQDCMANRIEQDYAVFVVADGLGGHQCGEKASEYLCRGLISQAPRFQPTMASAPATALKAWIDAAVGTMRSWFGDDPNAADAHTTCAMLYLDRQQTIAAHCGDSRIYYLAANQMLWRSKDHSKIQALRDAGCISEWEMGVHPGQTYLTRTVNVMRTPAIDCKRLPAIRPGDTFVLCSDGFWESIKDDEWLMLSQPDSGKPELAKLARMAVLRAQGKSDNCTVQWVRGAVS
ncbi:MAG: serine/threonine-protein phosphatase [Methylomonas sp.]|nr:serine/threonine-protein phosphatase [Methylomonas sp.]PPD21044.1 MAG: serine/threonine protein phosphatase [Methylomonas sp.]PPD27071.1 MAG: serine/threonine protein phosphatase [Methylomonas sp.]PPD39004.1 MAG: serine/threonine protein phosphatase [Methylomonas sp.]PPD40876.1 MAG: serine/threonine protein phosphatase [Methylomonas sp.]